MNILYLVGRHYVQTKMSRIRFYSIEALSKLCNVTISGPGFPNYDNSKSVLTNITNFEILNKKKYHCLIAYKPLELIDFCKVNILKIIRYNEMYDKNLTIQEINAAMPNIVICHHQNDLNLGIDDSCFEQL